MLVDVYLDGWLQDDVTAFDTEAGWITKAKRFRDGRLVVDYAAGELVTETVYGKVEAKLKLRAG